MGEPIAVLALRRKRDQISGTIAHYERLLREAEHDLAHINASLRLFEATGEAADLPPYVDLNRILRRGETTKICMDALAKEGPLDTRQLAMRVSRARAERHETERERRENDRLMAARTRRVGIFTAVLAIIAFSALPRPSSSWLLFWKTSGPSSRRRAGADRMSRFSPL